MIAYIPGMHKGRIEKLQKQFGLLPLGSGNKKSPYVYRGSSIIEAMEREAMHRLGESEEELEDE